MVIKKITKPIDAFINYYGYIVLMIGVILFFSVAVKAAYIDKLWASMPPDLQARLGAITEIQRNGEKNYTLEGIKPPFPVTN